MNASRRSAGLAMGGILAVLLVQFSIVEPTNFGGWDEWFLIDLASRGILGIPFQNRPLAMLFFWPGAAVWSFGFEGFKWVQFAYLAATGTLTFLLCRRLRGANDALAFLAGLFAAVWAPLDRLRIDVVLGRGGAGSTAALLFAILLLVESYRARRRLGLLLAIVVAGVVIRSNEAAAPMALAAPLLLLRVDEDRKAGFRWGATFAVAASVATAIAAFPFLFATSGSYQTAALGLDPAPLRVASRLLTLASYHLGPLFSFRASEVLRPLPAVAAGVFVGAWILVWRARDHQHGETPRAAILVCAAIGACAAALGWSAFALSGAIRSGARTQFLSAPGVGLLLASVAALLASAMPRRARAVVLGVCAACIVGLGTAATAKLQDEWDRESYWSDQNASLVQLTDLVPMTRENTLILLIDEAKTWPANFTFRHAIEYFYGGAAKGLVLGAHSEYLYPSRFTGWGVLYEPWPAIRDPWRSPVTQHRHDEIIVARLDPGGRLQIELIWPAGPLPPLPPGGRYDPLARVVKPESLPVSRSLLRRP